MKKPDRLRTHWDTLAPAELRQRQEAKLHRYIRDHAARFSKYYREVFAANGIRPDAIRTMEDLQRIPFTSKLDLLTTPEHPDRVKDFLLMPDEVVLRKRPSVIARSLFRGPKVVKDELEYEYRPVFLTSTTGRSAEPVAFLYSRHDLDNLRASGVRLVPVLGATREDRLLNMFPYAPHLAFWQTHYAVTAYGSFAVSSGGGKVMGTEGNLRLMAKTNPTALIGMPTFLYHVLGQAVEEGRTCDTLKTLVLGGEKVPPGTRRRLVALAERLGSKEVHVVATYGFTEAKAAWAECPFPHEQAASGYHLYPDLGLFEVIDPETGEVQPEGHPGELVYTPLDARGSVVLRYRTGDCIDGGLVYEPCPYCGRRMPRLIGAISRQSQMKEMRLAKLKGTLIDFNELEHVLDDNEHIGTWQIELRKINDDPMELDELVLHVVKTGPIQHEDLIKRLHKIFGMTFEVRPNVILFHTQDEMRRLQGIGRELKAKRVVDNRARENKPAPPRTWSEAEGGTTGETAVNVEPAHET